MLDSCAVGGFGLGLGSRLGLGFWRGYLLLILVCARFVLLLLKFEFGVWGH